VRKVQTLLSSSPTETERYTLLQERRSPLIQGYGSRILAQLRLQATLDGMNHAILVRMLRHLEPELFVDEFCLGGNFKKQLMVQVLLIANEIVQTHCILLLLFFFLLAADLFYLYRYDNQALFLLNEAKVTADLCPALVQFKGIIFMKLGDICYSTYRFDEAVRLFKKALEYF